MRKSLAIAWTQFRITMKSKAALGTMFAMPLAFIIIFGLMLGGQESGSPSTPRGKTYPLAVIDEDGSLAAALLIESLRQEPSLMITPGSRSGLDKQMADLDVLGGVAIPRGFGERVAAGKAAELELILHRGANLEHGIGPTLQRLTNQLTTDYNLAVQHAGSADAAKVRESMSRIAAERARLGAAVATEQVVAPAVSIEGSDYSALNHSALGYTVMSVMMAILLMAGVVLYERQHGTWGRLLTTPTGRFPLLLGYLLSFFFTGMIQFAILVAGTSLLFRIEWGPLLPLFTVGAAMVLAAAGIGLFFAGLVRTYEQQQTIGVVFVVASSMLGGLFWPMDLMSPAMQRIGHLTPQAWAMEALNEVALRGASWANLAWPLGVLLSLAIIFAGAGLLRVRYE